MVQTMLRLSSGVVLARRSSARKDVTMQSIQQILDALGLDSAWGQSPLIDHRAIREAWTDAPDEHRRIPIYARALENCGSSKQLITHYLNLVSKEADGGLRQWALSVLVEKKGLQPELLQWLREQGAVRDNDKLLFFLQRNYLTQRLEEATLSVEIVNECLNSGDDAILHRLAAHATADALLQTRITSQRKDDSTK